MYIKRHELENWRTVKKLGSLLGDHEDIERRKQLSIAALHKMNNVWLRKDKIRQEMRIKLYKSLIKPILLYNSATWGITKSEEESLNSFHRKQPRHVLNIKYPTVRKNKKVYEVTKENILSFNILNFRWKLFGSTLRQHQDSSAQKSMVYYFEKNSSLFKGRPRTTLPITINNDIKLAARIKQIDIKYSISSFMSKYVYVKIRFGETKVGC